MNTDPGSLSNLRDIVIPDPVPGWPPTLGMGMLVILILGLMVVSGWRVYGNWRRDAYRRMGLNLLPGAGSAYEVSVVLKRVALVAFPRQEVASLSGKEWVKFLQQTCPNSDVSRAASDPFTTDDLALLKTLARTWIREHKPMISPP